MELLVDKTTIPISGHWVRRWRLLSNIKEDLGITSVPWTNTGIVAVKKWVRLNEAMDKTEQLMNMKIPGRIALGSYSNIMDAYTNKVRSQSDANTYPLTGLSNYDVQVTNLARDMNVQDQFLMSDLYDVLQYMDPVSDSYLLHIVVDEALSFNRRKETYEKMGAFMASHLFSANPEIPSVTEMTTILYLLYYRTKERDEIYTDTVNEPGVAAELDSLIYSINKLPYIRLLGILAGAFNFTSSKGHKNLQQYNAPNDTTYLLDVNWNDVRDMIFDQNTSSSYLEGSSSIPLPGDMDKYSNTTVGRKLATYVNNIRRLVLMLPNLNMYANTLKLLAGVPMYDGWPGTDTSTLYANDTMEIKYTNYQHNPTFSTEGVQQLLEAIDRQVDITPPVRLIWLAWFVLGLGPILDVDGKYRPIQGTSLVIPFYSVLLPKMARHYRPTDQAKNKVAIENYPQACKYLLQTMGSLYLTICVKCLIRILEWNADEEARSPGMDMALDKKRIEAFANALIAVLEEEPDVAFNKFPEKR